MAKYGIKITYSNGDEEDGLYGNFASKEEAFKEICVLAAKEAYVQNEDFDELRTCSVYFNACEYKADLHYDVDDTWCYYRVQEFPDAERSDDRIRSIDRTGTGFRNRPGGRPKNRAETRLRPDANR